MKTISRKAVLVVIALALLLAGAVSAQTPPGFGLSRTSFLAHVAFGTVLGLLAERYLDYRGTILLLIRGRVQGSCGTVVHQLAWDARRRR